MEKPYILILFMLSLLVACQRSSIVSMTLHHANELLAVNPDSAKSLLEGIEAPEELPIKTYAYWLILYAEVCDRLHEDIPFSDQMEKAVIYYKKYGPPAERAKSLLYQGLSFEEENELNKAMLCYLSAGSIAEKAKDYKLTGEIFNKAARLYDFEDNYEDTRRMYQKAGDNFLLAGDSLNYIYALRDIGWIFIKENNRDEALAYNMKAYDLSLHLNDSTQISSLSNRLGIYYMQIDSFSLAEKYLLQSILYEKEESAPTFLSLSNLYMKQGLYDKANLYLSKASCSKTQNEMMPGGIAYQHYLLEKLQQDYAGALSYYERYVAFADSITDIQEAANILKIEKRYDYSRLQNQNYLLQMEKQKVVYVCILLIILCLFLVLLYQYRVVLKNKKILQQQQELQKKHIEIQEREFAVTGLENKILSIRENVLYISEIWKKVEANYRDIEKAKKNSLTDKDWISLVEIVNVTYVSFLENLCNKFPGLTNDEIRFCCLLKTGLDSQQLSILLNIQPTSVSHKRYRIMKKGKMENTDTTLEDIIRKL
ncbi:tetratricopeptide repeat protein [uncultured Parabacteroides sp.]|uniref:tetratricopeptide repeat protein n=1 Tax=uncultured Parabacteroides sp. TaxID=512312 RepID=UPI00260DBC98|nr:hypothetical protein [uncultured Parabacteroides sp.]